jgi:hypothetical protein
MYRGSGGWRESLENIGGMEARKKDCRVEYRGRGCWKGKLENVGEVEAKEKD